MMRVDGLSVNERVPSTNHGPSHPRHRPSRSLRHARHEIPGSVERPTFSNPEVLRPNRRRVKQNGVENDNLPDKKNRKYRTWSEPQN